MNYNVEDLLQIAKRENNLKRKYLLINPLQAKHIPVSPAKSLEMMQCLANKLHKMYPETKLVIGFAETATAIGAVVANTFSDECIYIHTTRENISNDSDNWINFLEEHSHAVEQGLFSKKLDEWISDTKNIIFIDDEISTGKTIINIVMQLKKQFPILDQVNIIAASILNRVSNENEDKLKSLGITSEYLLKIPNDDYSELVNNYSIQSAIDFTHKSVEVNNCFLINTEIKLPNPRFGIESHKYMTTCQDFAKEIVKKVLSGIDKKADFLILGTEECMYPALIVGKQIESICTGRVFCHATTRSPIGICNQNNYPIKSGFLIHSFYDLNRKTYIYNLRKYDYVIIVSDSQLKPSIALENMLAVLKSVKCGKIFFVGGA